MIEGERNAGLNILRQRVQIGRPRVPAAHACHRHHRQASHHEQTAIVVALGALNREGFVGVRHGAKSSADVVSRQPAYRPWLRWRNEGTPLSFRLGRPT